MNASRPVSVAAVTRLGLSQLICWGVTYYAIGVLGEGMGVELGLSRAAVFSGLSLALVTMGVASSQVGRAIDRHGGRVVMSVGSLVAAASCVSLALATNLVVFYAAWIGLGLAMRMTLYDAAFATLARIAGPDARRSIEQITLLGGLASSVFWPVGYLLAQHLGWRGALLAYAGFALLTLPLHLSIPRERYEAPHVAADGVAPRRISASALRKAALLYAAIVMASTFIASGVSAHAVGLLSGLGADGAEAVRIGAAIGICQSLARLLQIVFGRRLHALTLNLIAASLMPAAFICAIVGGYLPGGALVFACLYGVANGLLTISRGALPLALFDHASYGELVGWLIAPSFLVSAAAPFAYAWMIDGYGYGAALILSLAVAAVPVLAAVILLVDFRAAQQ